MEMLKWEEFNWAWKLLTTRAFGKFLPGTSLVPIAEYFNHSNTQTYYCYTSESEETHSELRYSKFLESEDDDEEWLERESHFLFLAEKLVNLQELGNGGLKLLDSLKVEATAIDNSDYLHQLRKKEAEDGKVEENHKKLFRIVAGEDFRQGEQVFLSYGRYSDKQLLSYYGFTLIDNCYNYVRVSLRMQEIAPDDLKPRISLLNYKEKCLFKIKPHCLNKELLRTIRGLHWNPHMNRDAMFSPENLELELNSLTVYNRTINAKLLGFLTTLEEDRMLLNSDVPIRLYFALVYRINVKHILHEHSKLSFIGMEIVKRLLLGEQIDEACRGTEYDGDDCLVNRESLSQYIEAVKIYLE